jgi:hypothetical protein
MRYTVQTPVLDIFIISILTAGIFVFSVGLNTLSSASSQEQELKQQEITLTVMLDDQGGSSTTVIENVI